MTNYLIEDADLQSGTLVKRPIPAEWLRDELVMSAERLRAGSADNLDLHDDAMNPTGCFLNQDVLTAFYELNGIPRDCTTTEARIGAIMSAVERLELQYAKRKQA